MTEPDTEAFKAAIVAGDNARLDAILRSDPGLANSLIAWGRCRTHPLHFVSDKVFSGQLPDSRAAVLVEALIASGAEVDFGIGRPDGETALIGAASLGAEAVGLALLAAGASPHAQGMFGETALHWAAMLGLERLVLALIPGARLDLRDAKYNSTALGWAVEGWSDAPAGSHGRQREVIEHLIHAGAPLDADWQEKASVRADPAMAALLRPGA
jgi:hypothetical protein